MDRWEFTRHLDDRDFESYLGDDLQEDDIVAYYKTDPDIGGFNHAAIYIGDGRVRGRWGYNEKTGFGGPVIESPIEEVLPGVHYDSRLGVTWLAFRRTE